VTEDEWAHHNRNRINICGYQVSKLPNGLYKIEGQPLMNHEQVRNWCYSRNELRRGTGYYLQMLKGIMAL
jgi:hypothetical protein